MSKKSQPTSRVLLELLETTIGLSEYGLVSSADMTRMKELCKVPSKRALAQGEREAKSGRRHGKLRD